MTQEIGETYNLLDLIEVGGQLKHYIKQYFADEVKDETGKKYSIFDSYEKWLRVLLHFGATDLYAEMVEIEDPRTGEKRVVRQPYKPPIQFAEASKEFMKAIQVYENNLIRKKQQTTVEDIRNGYDHLIAALEPIKKYARITRAFARDMLKIYKGAHQIIKTQLEEELEEEKQAKLEPFNKEIARAESLESELNRITV
ncbi:MAG: hypothetical protein QXS48_01370 [Candidatus Aenigmatarchaeota archaeon]